MNTFRFQLFTAPSESQRYDLRVGARAWTRSRINVSICILGHTCVGHTPIHKVTIQHLVHVCGRRFELQKCASVRAVAGTGWVTISHRSVRIGPFFNQTNEGKIHVDDFDFSFAHRDHQVHHTKPQGHKSTFCTFVGTTRRFTRV